MRSRTIVCPCEDVELKEIHEAIERGYEDLEALKRLTAVTTGPCQGKWCLRATLEVMAEATDQELEALGSITHRPPLHGVPLGALARCPIGDEGATLEADEDAEEPLDQAREAPDELGDPA